MADGEDIRRLVSRELEGTGVPGASVAVVHDGALAYAAGFGLAHVEQGRAATADTVYSIQSISKSYAAVSVLQLVERGRLELDRPVVAYLPYFRTADKAASDQITVRHLLSHTAGFDGGTGIANAICPNRDQHPWIAEMCLQLGITQSDLDQVRTREDVTRYFARVELGWSPGAGWKYCTDAYAIVGDLIDKAGGEPWERALARDVLGPLGLGRTSADPEWAMSQPDGARYYELSREGERAGQAGCVPPEVIPVPFPINPVAAPIGFLYSTAPDVARFYSGLMQYDGSPMLRGESLREMQTTVAPTRQGPSRSERGYALGIGTLLRRGVRVLIHTGGYTGVSATALGVPAYGLAVAVLTNCGTAPDERIAAGILDLCLDGFRVRRI